MSVVTDYYHQVWDLGNVDAMDRLCAGDYCRHISPALPPLSLAQQKERLAALRAAFPDMQVQVEELVEADGCAAVKMWFSGVHRGRFMNLEPSGKTVEGYAVELMRLRDGKIAQHWGGPDMADMARQIKE